MFKVCRGTRQSSSCPAVTRVDINFECLICRQAGHRETEGARATGAQERCKGREGAAMVHLLLQAAGQCQQTCSTQYKIFTQPFMASINLGLVINQLPRTLV